MFKLNIKLEQLITYIYLYHTCLLAKISNAASFNSFSVINLDNSLDDSSSRCWSLESITNTTA